MRYTLVLLGWLALLSVGYAKEPYLPDLERTPGAFSPDVTQDNLQETVCAPHWTENLMPPMSFLDGVKKEQMRQLSLEGKSSDYQEDHLVPLCAGGHPTDPRNLWPQRAEGDWNYKVKDQLEKKICRAMCNGELTLKNAQSQFLEPDWTRVFLKIFYVE